jgi:hypothetical protein
LRSNSKTAITDSLAFKVWAIEWRNSFGKRSKESEWPCTALKVLIVVEVKDVFISLFIGNYRKFANQNIYLFLSTKDSPKALNDKVQLGIFGTLAPHD